MKNSIILLLIGAIVLHITVQIDAFCLRKGHEKKGCSCHEKIHHKLEPVLHHKLEPVHHKLEPVHHKCDKDHHNIKFDKWDDGKWDGKWDDKWDGLFDGKWDGKWDNKWDGKLDNKWDDKWDKKWDHKFNNKWDHKLDNKWDHKLDNKWDDKWDNKWDDNKWNNKWDDNKWNNKWDDKEFKVIGDHHHCGKCGKSFVKPALPSPAELKHFIIHKKFNGNSLLKKCSCHDEANETQRAPEEYQGTSEKGATIYATAKDEKPNKEPTIDQYPADPVSLSIAYKQKSQQSIPEDALQYGFRKSPLIWKNDNAMNKKEISDIDAERLWSVDKPVMELKVPEQENNILNKKKTDQYEDDENDDEDDDDEDNMNTKNKNQIEKRNYLNYGEIGYQTADFKDPQFVQQKLPDNNNNNNNNEKDNYYNYKTKGIVQTEEKSIHEKSTNNGITIDEEEQRQQQPDQEPEPPKVEFEVYDEYKEEYKNAGKIETIEMNSEEFYNSPYHKEMGIRL